MRRVVLIPLNKGKGTYTSVDNYFIVSDYKDVIIPEPVEVPDATSSEKGIMKLYESLGVGTDGTINRTAITEAFNTKANKTNVEQIIRSKANGTFGSHTGDTLETVLLVIDINGGEYEPGDWMSFLFDNEKNANVAGVVYRARAGINGNTSDSLIATLSVTATTSRKTAFQRELFQFLTGNLLKTSHSTSGGSSDIALNGNLSSLISLNPANSWKLTLTATLSDGTQTCSNVGYKVTKTKTI